MVTYFILKRDATSNAYRLGQLYLATVDATRQYVGDYLRPALLREVPHRFIIEGMSRSYAAGSIARKMLEDLPGYDFKHASLNPLNLRNRADPFERGLIEGFRADRQLKEYRGLMTRGNVSYYVIARPGSPVEGSCLSCHGKPEAAPREIVQRYGNDSGFRMTLGDVVEALVVYIPIDVPLKNAQRNVLVFIFLYSVFFALLFLLINRRFGWFYGKMESDRKTIERMDSELLAMNREIEGIAAERTLSLLGLRVADRIRNPVTVIGGLCRILLKGESSPSVRDTLENMASECGKMEKVVQDFDSLVKKKVLLFKREDLNALVAHTVSLIERGIIEKVIGLSTALSDIPLLFNANALLISTAVNETLNYAVENTPQGGRIEVSTGIQGEMVFLAVTCTGKALSAKDIQRLFEPFSDTGEGLGSGLTLVKQIVEDHLGQITVGSTPDVGTTVTLTFPRRWKENELDDLSARTSSAPGGGN
jgi:signal transduction histidine kinase